MISALVYIEETLICAEVVRLLPKVLVPYVYIRSTTKPPANGS